MAADRPAFARVLHRAPLGKAPLFSEPGVERDGFGSAAAPLDEGVRCRVAARRRRQEEQIKNGRGRQEERASTLTEEWFGPDLVKSR